LDSPSAERGIRFATARGWDFWSYARLAELVHRCAAGLAGAGVPQDGRVGIIEGNGPHFVGLFFGAMLIGATPSPIAPRPAFGDHDRYATHLAAVLRKAKPDLLVHAEGLPAPGLSTSDLLAAAPSRVPARDPAPTALLQFTSGTSGTAKAVAVGHDNLAANLAAIAHWLEMTPQDATASWLPVHHDMGLVGCLLAPIVTGGDLWQLSPSEFVRRPHRYLECFGRLGARLTATPVFGLDHLVRRVSPQTLAGMDFSEWRAVIVGAERIAPGTLEAFARLAEPFGFDRRAFLPAYGLAEATLAVTGLPLRTGWSATPSGGSAVVGCGTPVLGATVAVIGDDGRPVPEGTVGEIVASGASVPGGSVATGDAGFLHNGQLHVLGRLGDSMKVRGRTVFAEDVDAAVTAACPAASGRVAALLGSILDSAGDGSRVVVLVERPRPEWIPTIRAAAAALTEESEVEVLSLPSGGIARTSSGKPRRRELWRAYLAGELSAATTPARTASFSGTR
jgi:acyl-CoA synthetase (AMP-forming)/AMP-acid ligase II